MPGTLSIHLGNPVMCQLRMSLLRGTWGREFFCSSTVLKYENLAEHSTVQADLDPGGWQGSEVHRSHVCYQNQALADTPKCPEWAFYPVCLICLLDT